MEMELGSDGNPILDQFSDEDFFRLVLRIARLSVDEATYRFQLAASYRDKTVGFDVTLLRGIESGLDADMDLIQDHVYRNAVHFVRRGIESDRFVSVMARLCGANSGRLQMVNEESFTAIAVHQGEIDFETDEVQLKLFGNDVDDDEETYYELFFIVDLANRYICLHEKDTDYREPLLRAWIAGS